MGGRVRPYGLPWTIYPNVIPPKIAHGGVKGKCPAGIAIPTIPRESELLPEWTKLKLIWGRSPWVKENFEPQTKAKQKGERKHHPDLQGFSILRGILFQSFLHVKFHA